MSSRQLSTFICILFVTHWRLIESGSISQDVVDGLPKVFAKTLDAESTLCYPDPCKNGGECVEEGNSFSCICENPYFGPTCELDCNCGENSKSCRLLEDGSVDCTCEVGYAQMNDTCKECYCGFMETGCRFHNVTGTKICSCAIGFSEKFGRCEVCDCGHNGICEFVDEGIKACHCHSGYNEKDGICTVCDCGHNGICEFVDEGRKACLCDFGYTEEDGICTAFSTSPPASTKATPLTTRKIITTAEHCHSDVQCMNGGFCDRFDNTCVCKVGYSGHWCQVDEICDEHQSRCNLIGGVCKRKGMEMFCVCPPGKQYKWQTEFCEDICDSSKCVHGTCQLTDSFVQVITCRCYQGYMGTYCDKKIPEVTVNPGPPTVLIILSILGTAILTSLCCLCYVCGVGRTKKASS